MKKDQSNSKEWGFCGKVRVHLMKLLSIAFGEVYNEKGEAK